MKCLICGKKTDERILCTEHAIMSSSTYGTVQECNSFMQDGNEGEGICQNYLVCQPIKSALKRESCIVPNLGRVVCPHLYENQYRIINSKFSPEQLEPNYPECMD